MQTDSKFAFRQVDGTFQLFCGSQRIGKLMPPRSGEAAACDTVTELEDGIFKWVRQYRFAGPFPKSVREISMDLMVEEPAAFWMIPAVSYDGNPWGGGMEPKGWRKDGESWTFASHRVSIPGATYSEGPRWSVALFGEAGGTPGFSCSLEIDSGKAVHRLLWPEQERPLVYAARDRYEPPFHEEWRIEEETVFATTAYIVVAPVAVPKFSYANLLDFAWDLHAHPYKEWHSPEQIWELGVRFAKESLWVEDGFFRGFVWGLYWNGQQWIQKREAPYEIGWVGQNASLANSLLADYLKTGDRTSLDMGLSVLDCWAEHAPLDNGLFRVRFDHLIGKKKDGPELNDACNLSTAALQYFEAFELAKRCGLDKPAYSRIALNICDFIVSAQQENGQWAKCWDNEGQCRDADGTIGAFCVEPLIQAFHRTGDRRYLDAAIQGYRFYMQDFVANGYSTAGALDTICIDKESSIPLLRSSLDLFEIKGEPKYLEWAELAAVYFATWQWHYSVRFPDGSPLQSVQYDSFGGTSVSVQHHHLDHYGLAAVPHLLKLASFSGNASWERRARAIWANATAVLSDGTLSVRGKLRPPGGQDEGFCETRWRTSMGQPFGVSQWLVAWPTAFRLELLRKSQPGDL